MTTLTLTAEIAELDSKGKGWEWTDAVKSMDPAHPRGKRQWVIEDSTLTSLRILEMLPAIYLTERCIYGGFGVQQAGKDARQTILQGFKAYVHGVGEWNPIGGNDVHDTGTSVAEHGGLKCTVKLE